MNRQPFFRPHGLALILAFALALSQAACVAGERRRDTQAMAALRMVDDFAHPQKSEQLWTPRIAGTGSVAFERGRVILDMPAASDREQAAPTNLALLFSKTTVRLAEIGDAARVTWDMQLLEDRSNTNGFGVCLGDAAGAHVVAGQTGQKCGTGTPHDFFAPGVPADGVDHGTGMLHYDMTVTLEDAKTARVRVELSVYRRDAKLDGEPDAYAGKGDSIAGLAGHGKVTLGGAIPLYLCVERDDAAGDPYIDQPRGRVAFSNVFVADTARP